jgi:hypothetical protein
MSNTGPIPGRQRTANARRRDGLGLMHVSIEVSEYVVSFLLKHRYLEGNEDDEQEPRKVAAALAEYIREATGDDGEYPPVTTSRAPRSVQT